MTYLSAGPDYYCLCQSLQQLNSSVSDPRWPSVLCCPHSHLVQTLPQSLQEAPLQLSVYVSTPPHSTVFARSILRITNSIQSVYKMYEEWQSTVCHMNQGSNKAIKINLKYSQFIVTLIRSRPMKYIHGMSASYIYTCIYPISFRVSQHSVHNKTSTFRIFARYIHNKTSFPSVNRYRTVTADHCLLAGLCTDSPFLRHFSVEVVLNWLLLTDIFTVTIVNSF